MTLKLFISYRSTDSAKVDAIVARLTSLKNQDGTPRYTPWQDKYGIPAGKDWWEAIIEAIVDCQIFVFNISEEALKSDVCRAELKYARERNRPIIPIVLEGEYIFNQHTGKHDIAYWDKIPSELNDIRAQFLFYEGTSFFPKFEQAISEFQREPQKWRDIKRPRPADPRPNSEATHDGIALYDEACDYASRLEFETARKLFQKLINLNDPDFGEDAFQWIELLGHYERIVSMDSRLNTRHRVRPLWEAYQTFFPKPFLENIFDPKGISIRFVPSTIQPQKPSPNSEKLSRAKPQFINSRPQVSEQPNDIPEFDNMSPDEILKWMESLVQRTSSVTPPSNVTSPLPLSTDLMPVPFVWMGIPAGKVTLKEGGYVLKGGQTFDVSAFLIAKYPITNAQFAKFVEAGGYSEKRLWTDAGWAAREKEKWTEPRYWTHATTNGAQQPVVGVSWYEGVAFCQWISEATGEKVMLPTEQQWQRAAQGDDGRIYPWGDEWNRTHCNNNVDDKGSKQTRPVQHYGTTGASPYGVVDMSGNVWEWCLTSYDDGIIDINKDSEFCVLRGGSWNGTNPSDFRVAHRHNGRPDWRGSLDIGFRIARLI